MSTRKNWNRKDQAWIKKDLNAQDREKGQGIHSGQVIAKAPYFTLRTYYFGLFPKSGNQIDPQSTASLFTLSFKGQVNIRRVSALLVQLFDQLDLNELKKPYELKES